MNNLPAHYAPDQLDAFVVPLPSPEAIERKHPVAMMADYALLAASTPTGEKLVDTAARVMRGILAAFGSCAIWEVRIALCARGLLSNDGKEDLDALGAVGVSLGLASGGMERPPRWANAQMPKSHRNVARIWVRPDQLGAFMAEGAAQRKRRQEQQDEIWLAAQKQQSAAARAAKRAARALANEQSRTAASLTETTTA
jgi:hypothetical protein